MSKLFLKVLLCGGVVLSTCPTLSMDKKDSEALDPRKRAISAPSAEAPSPVPKSQTSQGKSPTKLKSPSIGDKEKEKPVASTSGSSKEPMSAHAPKEDREKASQASSSIPLVGPSSGSKPSFMKGLQATQEKAQQTVKALNDTPDLSAYQTFLILTAPHNSDKVSTVALEIGPKLKASAKTAGLDDIIEALSNTYGITRTSFRGLTKGAVNALHPPLAAKFNQYLQPVYKGPTATEAQSDGTLAKYFIYVDGKEYMFPKKMDKSMFQAYLALSLTPITGEKD